MRPVQVPELVVPTNALRRVNRQFTSISQSLIRTVDDLQSRFRLVNQSLSSFERMTIFSLYDHRTMKQTVVQNKAGVGDTLADQCSSCSPWIEEAIHSGASSIPLLTVAAGILDGVTPLQFMDSIDVANHQLGNRAFLRWVESLQAEEPGAAIRAVGVPGRPPTAPLQLMPKKRKKKTEAAETPEGQQQELPDTAAAALKAPTRLDAGAGPEPQDPSLQAPSEEAAVAVAKKKKKKSRVQVALNTLRAEGIEAFRSYLEAGIGEPELLQTLTERISRAENLGSVKDAALGFVAARLRALDPAAGRATSQPVASRHVKVVGKAATAPTKTSLGRKEKEIFKCCLDGDAEKLRRLLRFGLYNLNVEFARATPLTLAAFKGHTACVKELLSARAIDVNLAQHDGGTVLFMAAQQGHLEIVRLLLEDSRVNVNLTTSTQTTPLCIAVQHGNEGVVRLLLGVPNINVDAGQFDCATPLFCAALDGYTEIVELLLRRGANANLPLDDGTTPLCAAIKQGHVEVSRLLLREPDIQVNQASALGITALALACEGGHKEIVRLLLRKKVSPNIATGIGIAPLHLASLHGHTAIVEILLNAGADMDAEVKALDEDTYTPYEIARLVHHREIASLLAARRRNREEQPAGLERLSPCLRPQGQALEDRPEPVSTVMEQAVAPYPPSVIDSDKPDEAAATTAALIAPDSQPMPEATHDPLETAKQALRQEVLGKLKNDNLESLDGIRLLVDINRTGDIDSLCRLYNRLAHIERQKERARRRKPSRRQAPAPGAEAAFPYTGAPRFALEDRQDLDADAIEGEIRRRLAPSRHRFVSQVVNNMEFGRGKLTSGYPGLLHGSAGIPGVGSCSVFYYGDATQNRIRIVGIGHHLDRETYRLDYATGELRGRRTLRLL